MDATDQRTLPAGLLRLSAPKVCSLQGKIALFINATTEKQFAKGTIDKRVPGFFKKWE